MTLLPRAFDFGDSVAALRANLTFRSASFRHAIRLAASLGVADALAIGLDLPHGYWLPLSAAIVLRPDFSATYVRGILRVGGTLLGLIVATVLVLLVVGNEAAEVAFVMVLVFAIRRLTAQNYGLATICITALVVILFSLLGANPEATIIARGLNTLLGGVLALVVYAVWPTWERTQTPSILAAMLDAYREYFDAVMTGYLSPAGSDVSCLEDLRLAARLARTNAEASLERLRAEPTRSEAELAQAEAFLATSNRFVRAAIALEAQMYAGWTPPVACFLRTFVADVDSTLCLLSRGLRVPALPLTKLPNLHDDLRALTHELRMVQGRGDVAPESVTRLAAFLVEAERIVDSLDALAQILRHRERAIATPVGRIASERPT